MEHRNPSAPTGTLVHNLCAPGAQLGKATTSPVTAGDLNGKAPYNMMGSPDASSAAQLGIGQRLVIDCLPCSMGQLKICLWITAPGTYEFPCTMGSCGCAVQHGLLSVGVNMLPHDPRTAHLFGVAVGGLPLLMVNLRWWARVSYEYICFRGRLVL